MPLELRWGAGADGQVGGGEPQGAGMTKLGDDNPGLALTKEELAERVLFFVPAWLERRLDFVAPAYWASAPNPNLPLPS